jgi:hypothetical protein
LEYSLIVLRSFTLGIFVTGVVLVCKHKAKNEYAGVQVHLYSLLHILSVTDGNQWLALRFGRLFLDKEKELERQSGIDVVAKKIVVVYRVLEPYLFSP